MGRGPRRLEARLSFKLTMHHAAVELTSQTPAEDVNQPPFLLRLSHSRPNNLSLSPSKLLGFSYLEKGSVLLRKWILLAPCWASKVG